MSYGKMRDIITVYEKSSEVVDTYTTDMYTPVATVRGYVKPTVGKKFFEAAAASAERIVTVITRYSVLIKENGRLEFNGFIYDIVSVVDIENRHVYMDIKCEVLVDG